MVGYLFFTCLQRCDLGAVGRSINHVYNGGKLLGHQHDNIEVSHEVGEL
jgi:hypothetical protein